MHYKRFHCIITDCFLFSMTSELEGMWQGKSALSLIGHRLRLPVGGASLFSLMDSSTPAGKNMETYAAVSVRERERERERERDHGFCVKL